MAKKKKTNAQILKKTKALLEKKETELAAAEKQAEELAAQKVTTVAAQKTAAEDLELRETVQAKPVLTNLKHSEMQEIWLDDLVPKLIPLLALLTLKQ
jgi:hypothetical protein